MIRTFSELIQIPSFIDRYKYLKLGGVLGERTFGVDRYLNQQLYKSRRWLDARDKVIMRDNGCDLSHPDYQIQHRLIVHHMNPITIDDVLEERSVVFESQFLICVSVGTHEAIHYGTEKLLPQIPIKRYSGDMVLWERRSNR